MKKFMQSIAVWFCCAVSDTDVYLIKAETVTVEEEKITIVCSARLKMVVIKDDHDPAYKGHQIWGRPAAWVFAKADKGTFVIHKPKPPIIKNKKLRPKNYEKGLKNLEKAWQSSIQAPRMQRSNYSPPKTLQSVPKASKLMHCSARTRRWKF